jgi:methanogenic corrinoid protein MtbC1
VTGLGNLVEQAFSLSSLHEAFFEVLAPALIEVGVRWEAGDVTVAQEHLATSTVRAAMQRLLADARADVRGVAVLACAPGEQHEIGLLMLAVLLRADGWQVAYLGADTPVPDAVELARVVGATALCFSAGTSEGAQALEAELTHVPTTTTVVLGGRGTDGGDAAAVVASLRRLAA